tara:strand:- start:10738 stop:12510 length:1773 start_codon:yes stop_codon:yes gene_type:complete
MNKTLNINLGGLIFHIDEDAFLKLEKYLTTLKQQFFNSQGGEEIIKDIEVRIAELFKARTSESKEVIALSDVDEVIAIMGKPEDYLDVDEEAPNYEHRSPNYSASRKRIFRDPDEKILGGVAAGLAAYLGIEILWMRIIFVILAFSGFSILFYVILWAIIPKARTTAEKLQMRGEKVNVSNIEKSVKEEFGNIGDNVKEFSRKAGNYDYQKPASALGDLIKGFFEFIINLVKLVFRFFFKIIGFGFLALGFIALLGLVAAFFSGSFKLFNGGYNLNDLYDLLQIVTANSAHFNLMVIGISLLIMAPLVMIIYLGVRIIFKLDPLGRSARSGLTGIAIVGFILVLISGIRLGLEFDRSSYYTKYQDLNSDSKTLYLQVNEDEVYERYRDTDFNLFWLQSPKGNLFNAVQLDIKKSKDEKLKIRKHINAQGNTRRAARNNAENVSYEYVLENDSVLNFDAYYTLKDDHRYRGQEVKLSLYLPVGTKIFLDENMVDIIYDIDNLNDYWDFDMVNHEWIMTNRGLKCTDCPKSEYEDDEDEEYIDEFEEEIPEEDEEEEEPIEDLDLSQASIQKRESYGQGLMPIGHLPGRIRV